jgi:hypothetical protein
MGLRWDDHLVTGANIEVYIGKVKAGGTGRDRMSIAASDKAREIHLELLRERPMHKLATPQHVQNSIPLFVTDYRLAE